MTWLDAAPAFLAVLAILYVPGIALGAVTGVRGILLWASAPAMTVALFAVLAMVLPWVHVSWSPLSAFLAALAVVLVSGAVRALAVGRIPWRPDHVGAPSRSGFGARWMLVAALGIPAIVVMVQTAVAFVSPDSISQTFDAIFHLNALRYIEDTGNASSFHIDQLVTLPDVRTFYPAAWHSLASLSVETTGVSIPVGANLTNIAIAAFAWPGSVIALATTLLPRRRSALIAAGVLAAAFPGFPLLMVAFGVLYPYFLALAFLPLALALGARVLRHAFVLAWRPALVAAWPLLLVLIATGLAQPAVVFAWAALLIPLVAALVSGVVRRLDALWPRAVAWAAFALVLIVFAAVWVYEGKLGSTTPWSTYTTPQAALWEAVTYSMKGAPLAIAAGVLTIVGIVRLARTPGARWYLGSWAIGLLLFGVAASLPSWSLRWMIAGLFYRDPPRLYALFTVISVPVAVFGAVWLWELASSFVLSRRGRAQDADSSDTEDPRHVRGRLVPALGVIGVVLLLAATQGPAIWRQVGATRVTYTAGPSAPVLSTAERTLIERLPHEVPASSVIAGDPWTGTAYAYALEDRRVLNPHFSAHISQYSDIINSRLDKAKTDPAVCAAVRDLHVGYVLDFGTVAKDAGDTGVRFDFTGGYTGLFGLVQAGVATEVDHQGHARLLKITACS